MRTTSTGKDLPGRKERWALRLLGHLDRLLSLDITVADCGYQSRFICRSERDAVRAMSLWIKEPGTMKWLHEELRPGDAFLDIGANIGIYTIAAAHRVGNSGAVYAIEPHRESASTLLRNITANGMNARVDLFPIAVGGESGPARFNYAVLESASTGSQLGSTVNGSDGRDFNPVASEIVLAATVDELIAKNCMRPPAAVKIDVDGIELAILRGMRQLLSGDARPRSVQVEVNPGERTQIGAFMEECGYHPAETGFTKAGTQFLAQGRRQDEIPHNIVFRPTHPRI